MANVLWVHPDGGNKLVINAGGDPEICDECPCGGGGTPCPGDSCGECGAEGTRDEYTITTPSLTLCTACYESISPPSGESFKVSSITLPATVVVDQQGDACCYAATLTDALTITTYANNGCTGAEGSIDLDVQVVMQLDSFSGSLYAYLSIFSHVAAHADISNANLVFFNNRVVLTDCEDDATVSNLFTGCSESSLWTHGGNDQAGGSGIDCTDSPISSTGTLNDSNAAHSGSADIDPCDPPLSP